ncbi:MAG: hypothetical protein MUO54_03215 [Anaerolineales bacterium]|nr:hypothetical protein [Anaerolineales bacterium]
MKLEKGTGAVSRLPGANVVSNGGTNCLGGSPPAGGVKVPDFNCGADERVRV